MRLDDIIDTITEQDVIDYAKKKKMYTLVSFEADKSSFICTGGAIIDCKDWVHETFITNFIKDVYHIEIANPSVVASYFTMKLGLVIINAWTGHTRVNADKLLTHAQEDTLKKWFSILDSKKIDNVEVYLQTTIKEYDLNKTHGDSIVKNIQRFFTTGELVEGTFFPIKKKEILNEATRRDLINKSRNADNYKDKSKGKNRYDRRTKSRNITPNTTYNRISMDNFFKRDALVVPLQVQGETDRYNVLFRFNGIQKEIQREVKRNKGKLDFKVILRALLTVFNNDEVFVSCTCPDFRYRIAYYSSKGKYISTTPETRPSRITNPNDSKGAGCKHILLLLANLDWMMKVASVLHNYVVWAQKNMEKVYADIIYPKLYGQRYNKEVQLGIFDDEDEKVIGRTDLTTSKVYQGRDDKGRFVKNNPFAFKKRALDRVKEDPKQLHFNIDKNKVKPDFDKEEETSQ